jgi:hypothetical protein
MIMNDGLLRIMEGSSHGIFSNITSEFTLQKKEMCVYEVYCTFCIIKHLSDACLVHERVKQMYAFFLVLFNFALKYVISDKSKVNWRGCDRVALNQVFVYVLMMAVLGR